MGNIEIEHPEGQKELTRLQKLEAKKDYLRDAFGADKFDKLLAEAKDFLTIQEKERRRRYGEHEM